MFTHRIHISSIRNGVHELKCNATRCNEVNSSYCHHLMLVRVKVLRTTQNYRLCFVHPLLAKLLMAHLSRNMKHLGRYRMTLYQSINNKYQLCQRLCYYNDLYEMKLSIQYALHLHFQMQRVFLYIWFAKPCLVFLFITNLNPQIWRGIYSVSVFYFILLLLNSWLLEFHKYVLANCMTCAALIFTS